MKAEIFCCVLRIRIRSARCPARSTSFTSPCARRALTTTRARTSAAITAPTSRPSGATSIPSTPGSWSNAAAHIRAFVPGKTSTPHARRPRPRGKPTSTTSAACTSRWKRPSAASRRASPMSFARTCPRPARLPLTTSSTATWRSIATRWTTTCSSRRTACRPTTLPTSSTIT